MRGFTLIELVAVLILIAILAVAVFPRVPEKESLTIKGRAEQLASDIRYVQTLSMTRGERFCIAISGTGYRLQGTTANACDASKPETHPAGLTQPIAICGSDCTVTAPTATIQFDGLGVPWNSAGDTALGNSTVTISDAGGSKQVQISQTTGRVVVQ
jgi:prepilin-type N-terminal cleavage/methylation domain-containing protein